MTTTPEPRYVEARIDADALSRVSRFYDASLDAILRELIQNARRAGAKRLHVAAGSNTLRLSDDGSGIADPQDLLSFGKSRWDDNAESEDPAGMGFFSLAQGGCHVESLSKGAPGFALTLQPGHFTGDVPKALVEPLHNLNDDLPRRRTGVTVSFKVPERNQPQLQTPETLKNLVEAFAFYLPEDGPKVTVSCDSSPRRLHIARKDFLEEALHVKEWQNLRIGVFKNPYGFNETDVNFFGHLVDSGLDLPMVRDTASFRWHVRVDVQKDALLRMTLPQRKSVVQDEATLALKEQALLAIYEAIARSDDPRPAFADWKAAREMGVDMPQHPPLVPVWLTMKEKEQDGSPPASHWKPLPENGTLPCVVSPALETAKEATLREAFAYGQEENAQIHLLENVDRLLRGYPFYDALPHLHEMKVFYQPEENADWVDADRPREENDQARHPKTPWRLQVGLRIAPQDAQLTPDGAYHTLETQYAASGETLYDAEDQAPGAYFMVARRNNNHDCYRSEDFLVDAFFLEHDDLGADSYDTQEERFRNEALRVTRDYLESDPKKRLAAAIDDALRFAVPALYETNSETLVRFTERGAEIVTENPFLEASSFRAGRKEKSALQR